MKIPEEDLIIALPWAYRYIREVVNISGGHLPGLSFIFINHFS